MVDCLEDRCIWEYNYTTDKRNRMAGCGMVSISGHGSVVGSCEHGYEPSGSIHCGEIPGPTEL